MDYYCPIHVTTHQWQQHQGVFSPFHPQAYFTHEPVEGNAKAGVWLWGELLGGPCALCFATQQGNVASLHPLQCIWLTHGTHDNLAGCPGFFKRWLFAASIPSALQGKGLLERTRFPSTSPGSLRLGKPPFTAGCSKGRGFLSGFFLPSLCPGRKWQNHRWCNSIRNSQGWN